MFYTDGVTEARDEAGNEFGMDRLADAVDRYRALPANEMARRISHDVYAFQAPDLTMDDLTLSIVKYDSSAEN
ncbi:MAG: SpoIIE family protein phosphatase [bacterium]|nr:SpoIIE family protein phosphatase [bacterium]